MSRAAGGTAPRLVRRVDAARQLGVDAKSVDRLIREGRLSVVMIGSEPRITQRSLDKLAPPPEAVAP